MLVEGYRKLIQDSDDKSAISLRVLIAGMDDDISPEEMHIIADLAISKCKQLKSEQLCSIQSVAV